MQQFVAVVFQKWDRRVGQKWVEDLLEQHLEAFEETADFLPVVANQNADRNVHSVLMRTPEASKHFTFECVDFNQTVLKVHKI